MIEKNFNKKECCFNNNNNNDIKQQPLKLPEIRTISINSYQFIISTVVINHIKLKQLGQKDSHNSQNSTTNKQIFNRLQNKKEDNTD